MTRSTSFALALGLGLSVSACSNPADGKPQAKVEDAAPAEAEPKEAAAASATDKAFAADVASSTLGFVGSKVTGSHEGGFKAFTAEVTPTEGKVEGGKVAVEIDIDSMFTDSEKLTGHLKSPDFFDAEKHPKAKFTSTEIKAGGDEGYSHTVVGNLEMHGVTKKITFPATIEMKGGKIDVDSEFSINRKDFGMKYAGKADDLIRDEVVIKLDLTFSEKA